MKDATRLKLRQMLASQIDYATRTLHNPDSSPDAIRKAVKDIAEFTDMLADVTTVPPPMPAYPTEQVNLAHQVLTLINPLEGLMSDLAGKQSPHAKTLAPIIKAARQVPTPAAGNAAA